MGHVCGPLTGDLQMEFSVSWGQLSRTEVLSLISLTLFWPESLGFRFFKKNIECLILMLSVQGWALSTSGGLLPPLPLSWPKALACTWPHLFPKPLLLKIPLQWSPLSSHDAHRCLLCVLCAPAASSGVFYGVVLLSLLSVMFPHLMWSLPKIQGAFPLREASSFGL